MTPQELEKHGLRVKPLVWEEQSANGFKKGRWSASGHFIDRIDGDLYLYAATEYFSHALAVDAANAGRTARIAAALEPIAQPVSVAAAARVADDPRVIALVDATNVLITSAVELAKSGDAGYWDAEKTPEIIQARAALRSLSGEGGGA